jgi:hypothetical protein
MHSGRSSPCSSSSGTSCAWISYGVVPGLLLWYRCLHFLLRSCMMQWYKYLCKWYIEYDGVWWSWVHVMEMNTLRFIGWYRGNTFLLSSQHHPRTSTTSTCHLLHSLCHWPRYFSANYYITITQVLLHFYQHNYTDMLNDISKWFYASKIHLSFTIKLIIHKEYYFISLLN